jgi:broad specificity phosphatase PhoE
MKSPSIGHSSSHAHHASTSVRLLIVRHGRSANKSREKGQAASSDPELSEQGFEQAEALGEKLAKDLMRIRSGCLIIASSPMRRCLLTVRPAIFKLNLAPDDCLCHGALYEFGCAGLKHTGTNVSDIAEHFPEFAFTGFTEDGDWDYRGNSDRETEEEARKRAAVIGDWLWYVAEQLSQRDARGPKVIVLSFHQTMADLVCQLLVDGTTDHWVYGEMKYKLFNTGVTEIIMQANGTAVVGEQNDFSHLDKIGGPAAKNPPVAINCDRTGKMIAKLREEFSKLDGSGDYKLNFSEMSTLLRKGKPDMSEEQMWKIFRSVDTTHDGDIDFDEFLSFLFGQGSAKEAEMMMTTLKLG